MQKPSEKWRNGLWLSAVFEEMISQSLETNKTGAMAVLPQDYQAEIARKGAIKKLTEQLHKGSVIAVGREGGDEHRIAEITPEFWVSAIHNFSDDTAHNSSIGYTHIKVLISREASVASSISGFYGEPTKSAADVKSKGGRPNTSDEIKRVISERLGDPDFRNLENRTKQAEDIRAIILGEDHRHSHSYPGFRDDTIKRLIGELDKRGET